VVQFQSLLIQGWSAIDAISWYKEDAADLFQSLLIQGWSAIRFAYVLKKDDDYCFNPFLFRAGLQSGLLAAL